MSYLVTAKSGKIVAASEAAFPAEVVDFYKGQGCTVASGAYERGYDGQLYKAGEAPEKPADEIADEMFAALRAERDARLAACDWTMLPDAPVTEEEQAAWKAYRQALRDLPQQEGAPCDGGGEQTPWPVAPNGETVADA